ncbi:MAG: hypothetical protein KKF85_05795 [Gammaproteobacteria bacterium]|nr:hypothetical protein [Rhodocyclaceae bacterium]MBU3910627.1 hypothetical protein [Gammaproteobacteria bacterium]MBU3988320.1 hypothetical protein [Gammaproteobacteria bacterium]MBU4005108.1 hypothetical protein [Gammaproteobacteria bacterium]MBU4020701.1 hypothetical protein [Gammaproteobacteria bacterium]
MNRRQLTLIEVLQPQCFNNTPERSRVTRTIVQPEIDSFEQMEAQANATEKSAPRERGSDTIAALVTQQMAPQLVVA